MNEHLVERFGRQSLRRGNNGGRANNSEQPRERVNLGIREYVHAANAPAPSGSKNAWLGKEEVPTRAEMIEDADQCVQLGRNRLDKPWPNTKKYLSTHYELLREDSVSPLRDAINKFKRNPNMDDEGQLAIYEKVHICGFTFANQGLAARIRFSTARSGRNIAWEASKRLTPGTLLALTPKGDFFKEKCILATVAARPLDNVTATPPMIDILFARAEELEFDPQLEFVMIEERTGYFEAARHTLKALQKLGQESFPLKDQIVHLDANVPPPTYLLSHPTLDISALCDRPPPGFASADVNILTNWPLQPSNEFDESQWAALHQILSSRLSIVQGPPGTGKTYVSVAALKVLLQNRNRDDGPIIITAQTNHALDQILTHVSRCDNNFIRLGGRSKVAEIIKHTPYELRKEQPVNAPTGSLLRPSLKNKDSLTKAILNTLEPFVEEAADNPLTPEVLVDLGVITNQQGESLIAGANEWVTASPSQEQDPMRLWLHQHLRRFVVTYSQTEFGYDEGEKDEEYEQLKEQEAEAGLEDDGDPETLKGRHQIIEDNFTCRASSAAVSEAEAHLVQYTDLWDAPERARGAMYQLFQQKAKLIILQRLRLQAQQYADNIQSLQIGKWEADIGLLQHANVIGMTTTGFSKYRPLIASLKPKIILIEEAAEVIEAPVTVACVESLEHLILVGDHQQLQGSCNVQQLADEFNLNVSMFERLVGMNMPFRMLTRQRRMNPEIRRALAPIYPELEDHPSVLGRPPVPGMGGVSSFFFTHDWLESSDSMQSRRNEPEAEFVVGFYLYLVLGCLLSPSQITVLTFYNGQRKLILKLLKQHRCLDENYLTVKTVDSYQGEENKVVLLSLVRSNAEGKMGFLDIQNRVCVALSRAKIGFYLFGNADLLSQNLLWSQVIDIMSQNPNRVGAALPVACVKHNRRSTIAEAHQWNDMLGCDIKCEEILRCGHKCSLKCHVKSHDDVRCEAPCPRLLRCGHPCNRRCSDEQCSCDKHCDKFRRRSDQAELRSDSQPSSKPSYGQLPGNLDGSGWATGTNTHNPPQQQRNQGRQHKQWTGGYGSTHDRHRGRNNKSKNAAPAGQFAVPNPVYRASGKAMRNSNDVRALLGEAIASRIIRKNDSVIPKHVDVDASKPMLAGYGTDLTGCHLQEPPITSGDYTQAVIPKSIAVDAPKPMLSGDCTDLLNRNLQGPLLVSGGYTQFVRNETEKKLKNGRVRYTCEIEVGMNDSKRADGAKADIGDMPRNGSARDNDAKGASEGKQNVPAKPKVELLIDFD